MQTVIDFLRHWARVAPDKEIFTFRTLRGQVSERLTFHDLERRTNGLAARLVQSGAVRHGEPVLLACHPGLAVIEGLIACAKVGAIAAPVPPVGLSSGATGIERLAAVAADTGARCVLADHRQIAAIGELRARGAPADGAPLKTVAGLEWLDLSALADERETFEAAPHDILFLQYTSGSTRQPRGVMVSHANVVANRPADGSPDWVCVSWLPHYHDMGLIGYFLFPLMFGGSSHIFATADFMRRPALWFETMSAVRATNTSAPDFAYAYCLREDKLPTQALAGLDLSSLRDVMNASEPVRPATVRAFATRFAANGLDPNAMTVAYGLAENTLRVSVGGRIHLALNKERLVHGEVRPAHGGDGSGNVIELASCGAPITGARVRIVDPETGETNPPGVPGEIWVGGAGKARGYWRQPELSEAVFQARLAGDDTTYLRTGDVGFVQDGEIYVSGRLRDMVVLRGRNIFPADVEGAIEARFPETETGRVTVFGSEDGLSGERGMTILLEPRRGADAPPLAEIHRFAVNAFQVPVDEVALVRRGGIVKTSSGKIARSRCQKDFASGRIDVLERFLPAGGADGHESIDAYLDALLERGGTAADDGATIGELGLDSVELVELSLRLEELARSRGLDADGDLAAIHDLRLLQAATIGEVRATIAGLSSGEMRAAAVAASFGEAIDAVAREEARAMRADSALDEAMVPAWSATAPGAPGSLLLTGASGFLGGFLLEALLRLRDEPVIALVRAQSAEHGRARLRSSLMRCGLTGRAADDLLARRVEVVRGDVGAPRLGLDDASWRRLAGEVGQVFHCAAEVDYRKTYAELSAANVEGTREVIRFCMEGRRKVLDHISTTFIFGWTNWHTKAEHMGNAEMSGLDFGYAQSKWVAEQLVFEAERRGLPVRVFRPSLISASRSGHFVRTDILSRLFGYWMRHGVSATSDKQMSLLPVDVCAQNIVAISRGADHLGGAFHLTSEDCYTAEDVCRIISCDFGYRFDYRDIDGFVEHLNANCVRGDELFPLKSFINASKDKLKDVAFERYDNRRYLAACAVAPGAMAEPPLEETAARLVTFLRANGLVPPPPDEVSRRRGGDFGGALLQDAL